MSRTRKIRFAIPKGNLNKRADYRGYTGFLLQKAGFKMEGYKPGKEAQMPFAEGERDIEFYCMKPKEMPLLLESGVIDVAIFGKDTLEERCSEELAQSFDRIELLNRELIENKKLEKFSPGIRFKERCSIIERMLEDSVDNWLEGKPQIIHESYGKTEKDLRIVSLADLGLGRVDINLGVQRNRHYDINDESIAKLVLFSKTGTIASAYPNITKRVLMKSLGYETEPIPTRQHKIKIYPITSSTEMMIKLGIADIVVDSVASGDSFRRNDLVTVGKPITSSTSHIYANPNSAMLYGAYAWSKIKSKRVHFEEDEINVKRFYEIVQRLKEASHQYGLTRKDSIYYKEKTQ